MLSQSGLDVLHSVQSEIRLSIQTGQSIGSQKVITQTLNLKKVLEKFFFLSNNDKRGRTSNQINSRSQMSLGKGGGEFMSRKGPVVVKGS